MNMYKKIALLCAVVVCCLQATSQKITASFTTAASTKSFSGKVFLYLSKDAKNPKDEMVGVDRFPCFAITEKNVKPNDRVVFNDAAISYPVPLSDIERGKYNAQVVWDKNEGGRSISESPGNMYNDPVTVTFTKNTSQSFGIVCKEVSKEPV